MTSGNTIRITLGEIRWLINLWSLRLALLVPPNGERHHDSLGSDEEDYERRKSFLSTDTVKQWPGLVHVPIGAAKECQKQWFIDEWFLTLQMLRNIGSTVADDRNRPSWIPDTVPSGAKADQFLHAYYFKLVIVKGRSLYAEKFEANTVRR